MDTKVKDEEIQVGGEATRPSEVSLATEESVSALRWRVKTLEDTIAKAAVVSQRSVRQITLIRDRISTLIGTMPGADAAYCTAEVASWNPSKPAMWTSANHNHLDKLVEMLEAAVS